MTELIELQAAITEFACRAAENCANKAATRDLQEAKSLARLYEQQAFVWAADDGLPSLAWSNPGDLYVSRGIGTSMIPLRIGAWPEIEVLELRQE